MSASSISVIESLRRGIPPDNSVCYFTVGRKEELKGLDVHLLDSRCGALLLKANYGAGKTHLLRFVREKALSMGFAVSYVEVDCQSAARFNRMDQMLGAILRNIEIPKDRNRKGIAPFFDLLAETISACQKSRIKQSYFAQLSDNFRWGYSDILESPPVFIALRAWLTGKPEVRDRVTAWLHEPHNYETRKRDLQRELIEEQYGSFSDPRSSREMQQQNAFSFRKNDYQNAWSALRDFNTLAKKAGFRGLTVLFDEFEDVIHNLERIDYKESALWNLFHFMIDKKFLGKTFFAVTPGFAEKCKRLLIEKGRDNWEMGRFDRLISFELSPLCCDELKELSRRIIKKHGRAYDWEPEDLLDEAHFDRLLKTWASAPSQDRARAAIKNTVKYLDDLLEESERK